MKDNRRHINLRILEYASKSIMVGIYPGATTDIDEDFQLGIVKKEKKQR